MWDCKTWRKTGQGFTADLVELRNFSWHTDVTFKNQQECWFFTHDSTNKLWDLTWFTMIRFNQKNWKFKMIPRAKNKRFSKIQATKKGIWDMIQPINPVTLVLFVVWHCPQWNSGGFFRLWLWSYLDSGSKFYVAASSRSPGKIHFKLWNIFFCIVLHHFYRAFESSLQVASLRRGIGVCAMLGEPQLRVRVPRMCQPRWCPAASVVLWRNITGSRDACHFSVERWWQGRWMYFSYIMYVLWYIINDMCNIYI